VDVRSIGVPCVKEGMLRIQNRSRMQMRFSRTEPVRRTCANASGELDAAQSSSGLRASSHSRLRELEAKTRSCGSLFADRKESGGYSSAILLTACARSCPAS
jgi:hypothetical protein